MKACLLSILLCIGLFTQHYAALGNSLKNSMGFEENKGQIYTADGKPAKDVRFRLSQGNTQIFLTNTGIIYQFTYIHYPEHLTGKKMSRHNRREMIALKHPVRVESYRMNMILEGASPDALITPEEKSKDFINYYNKNVTGVHHYQKITYHNVYPGIDWIIYTNQNGIKYDFIVHPGADPQRIKLKFEHHDKLFIDNSGNLIHANTLGTFTENKPVSLQDGKEINTDYILENNVLSFYLNKYDPTKKLIIDPMRIWATYYGGMSDEDGNSCATDSQGNVYLAGTTASSNNIAFNGYQNTQAGITYDAFIAKFDSNGVRLWATYFGGVSGDYGLQCVVDNNDNIILAGTTQSTDLTTLNAHQPNTGGGSYDAFLAKFNASGNLLWSTYYGGLGEDEGYSVAADGNGNIYLAGTTNSTTGIAFNGHLNIYGGTGSGVSDAFLVKFDSSGLRQWGTYYGTPYVEEGLFCATDGLGNVYLTGVVGASSTFDIASNGHQNIHGGGTEAFLVKFNTNGVRDWATYYGGSANDEGYCITTDSNHNIFLAGSAHSTNNISFNGHQNVHGGSSWDGGDAFLVKFDNSGSRLWATYYGGNLSENGYFCTVDNNDNVYLTGFTGSSTGIAYNGFQMVSGSGFGTYDAFLVKFDANGVRLWGTYYGGPPDDFGLSIATDPYNNVYMAGSTRSDTDIAFNGHQNTFAGLIWDAFLVKFEGGTSTHVSELPGSGFNIYPNPVTNNEFYISFYEMVKNLPIEIQIVDVSGRIVQSAGTHHLKNENPIQFKINPEIKSGLYTVRILGGDNKAFTRKIMIFKPE